MREQIEPLRHDGHGEKCGANKRRPRIARISRIAFIREICVIRGSSFFQRRVRCASNSLRISLALLASLAVAFSFSGCAPQSAREVIVYTSLDEEFSRPILAEFTRETGIEVR